MFLFQLFAFAHFFGFGFPPLYNVFVFFFVQVWWSFLHILCSKQTISFLLPAGRTAKRNGIEDTENRQNFTFFAVSYSMYWQPFQLPSILGEVRFFQRLLFAKVAGGGCHTAPLKSLQSDPIPSRAGPLTHPLARGPLVCVSVSLRFLLDHDLDVSKHSRIPSCQPWSTGPNNYNGGLCIIAAHNEILHSAFAYEKSQERLEVLSNIRDISNRKLIWISSTDSHSAVWNMWTICS